MATLPGREFTIENTANPTEPVWDEGNGGLSFGQAALFITDDVPHTRPTEHIALINRLDGLDVGDTIHHNQHRFTRTA